MNGKLIGALVPSLRLDLLEMDSSMLYNHQEGVKRQSLLAATISKSMPGVYQWSPTQVVSWTNVA